MASIYFAVIALKKSEIRVVAQTLRDQNMVKVAGWLEQNKDQLYGDSREDWKPFIDNISIRDLMSTGTTVYQSATALIDRLDEDITDLTPLLKPYIELYIIDVFALFLKKYKNLASKIDYNVAQRGKCCLVVPYGISKEFQEIHDLLLKAYSNLWHTVYSEYRRGSLSRIVLRPDDLSNFREYLSSISKEDLPNLTNYQELNSRWGQPTHTSVPRVGR
jgi:hypothetical protein